MSSAEGRRSFWRLACLSASAVVAITACGSSNTPTGSTQAPPPTANMKPQTSVGAGEGQLNLVLWDGYADKSWADPFQQVTDASSTCIPPAHRTRW